MCNSLGVLVNLIRLSSVFCASERALESSDSRWCANGVVSSRGISFADGSVPINSSNGVNLVRSCFHELCANSAIGRRSFQLFCCPLTNALRYVSIHWFMRSVCPSVRGWNAVLIFCCTPVALHTAFAKLLVNLGSLSDIMRLGIPNHGNKCLKYSRATPAPSIVL